MYKSYFHKQSIGSRRIVQEHQSSFYNICISIQSFGFLLVSNMNNIKPLFVKQRDLTPEQVREENMPTCFELCTSLSRSSNGLDIDGAQLVRGTWKIYLNIVEDRATLLATGFSFRGRIIPIYNEHPSVHNTRSYPS